MPRDTWCPDCGSPDTEPRPKYPHRPFGPGEWAIYTCADCGEPFEAIVPEPADAYEGDGVFAENH